MNILFLTQVLPYPLDAGPKIRAYYVLRYLAQAHQITLVSFVRATDSPEAVQHLRSFCQDVHTLSMPRSRLRDAGNLLQSLLQAQPFLIVRDWLPAMTELLTTLLGSGRRFDAIHADQLWMAPYALWVGRQLGPQQGPPQTLLDGHNAVYLIPQRMAVSEPNPLKRLLLQLESRKLLRYELQTCQAFDQVVWVSAQDHAALQAAAGQAVPNSAVIPISEDPTGHAPIVRRPDAHRVTFLGGLHWPPNALGVQWFMEQVWPQVQAACPEAILTIIGKDPPPSLQGLANGSRARVEITGYVPDPAPFLAETAAFVVPLHAGGGMRVKILDAWKSGLPVVSTGVGAEGIQIQPDRNILIADTAADFAQATIRLVQNPGERDALARAGRAWVEHHYDWRTVYRAWDRFYPLTGSASSHTDA